MKQPIGTAYPLCIGHKTLQMLPMLGIIGLATWLIRYLMPLLDHSIEYPVKNGCRSL